MTGASTEKQSHRRPKEYLKIFGPAFLLTLIGFIVAYQFVQPAPPKHIAIGTGSKTGAYYPFGLRYSEILARDGITLEVLSTAGSIENIKLLLHRGGLETQSPSRPYNPRESIFRTLMGVLSVGSKSKRSFRPKRQANSHRKRGQRNPGYCPSVNGRKWNSG